MSTATTTIQLPQELKAQLEELATATERSEGNLVIDALRWYVEYEAWKLQQIEVGLRQAEAGLIVPPEEMDKVFARLTGSEVQDTSDVAQPGA